MLDPKPVDLSRIAQDLQIRKLQVESVVLLLDEGNTIPFIARYRKEKTAGLGEDAIRQIQRRLQQQRHLADRKETILKSIESRGKLTEELRNAILEAENPRRLEDVYLPFKPKKRTAADAARERGLDALSQAIWNKDPVVANLNDVLPGMVNPDKQLASTDDVLLGVKTILSEQIAENAEIRGSVRSLFWQTGKLVSSKKENLAERQGLEFKDYFQFTESVRQIPAHRILAINRGEKEGLLNIRVEFNKDGARNGILEKLPFKEHPHEEFLKAVAEYALSDVLVPELEREVRRELTEEAEDHAAKIFARNLRSLLLQRPLRGSRVLAIDPGFRSGCKIACLDEQGQLLEDAVIYPHQPQKRRPEARFKLEELVRKHQITVIAIGNGTACRETEELVADLIDELDRRRKTPASPASADAQAAPPDASHLSPEKLEPHTEPSAPIEIQTSSSPAAAVPTTDALPATEEPPPTGAETPAPLPAEADVSKEANPANPEGTPAATGEAQPGTSSEGAPATTPGEAGQVTQASAASVAKPSAPVLDFQSLKSLPEAPADLAYIIINEAGASLYAGSTIGREELPNYEAALRSAISIGRRLQEPLHELVKVDPQSVGVGLYQHDVSPRHLKESLEAVVESSVNHVGVDLNNATAALLRYVSGFNQLVARAVVDYRNQHGGFRNRQQLLEVPGFGPARFLQAAGFIKVTNGDNPLDRTWIHPESYPAALGLLTELGFGADVVEEENKLVQLRESFNNLALDEMSNRLQIGTDALVDIMDTLARPGKDPREDLPPPILRRTILKLEDLKPGMELKGTVLNVVDFGVFVDIGLKDSGLVHISQIANRYIKNPYEIVAVGDPVSVWVMAVESERRRVSLTMIQPGSERKPPEARSRQADGQRPQRRRGRPPVPAHAQAPAQGQEPSSGAPRPGATGGLQVATASRQEGHRRPEQRPPPRKPKRHQPKPKLSQAALEGKAPLRTFSELQALFEARDEDQGTNPPPDKS